MSVVYGGHSYGHSVLIACKSGGSNDLIEAACMAFVIVSPVKIQTPVSPLYVCLP